MPKPMEPVHGDGPVPSAELPPEVVARLPQRDPEALALFFDAWVDRIYGFVRRMVADDHLAEDLTQDVLYLVQRGIGSFDPSRGLRPWVFAIASNRVRDYWRSRRHRDSRSESSVERDGAAEHVAGGGELPEVDLARREMDVEVRRAIEDLPEGMRVTVHLRVYEEMSFEEIGRVLDRSEVAVRKRYSRALEQLRSALGAAYRVHAEGG